MRRVDALIAVVLVAAVAGSALGAFTYDEDRKSRQFDVTWALTERQVSTSGPAAHAAAGDTEVELPVTDRNITTAALTVTVSGSGPRAMAETVTVTVEVPGLNETFSDDQTFPAGGAAELAFEFAIPVNDVPGVTSVRGRDAAAAGRELDRQQGSALGTGTWRITVAFAGAGLPGPLDTETHSVAAQAAVERYSAELGPRVPDINR